jgi:hypothetical protein
MKRSRRPGRHWVACGMVCALVACAAAPPPLLAQKDLLLIDEIFVNARTNPQIEVLITALKSRGISCNRLIAFRVTAKDDGSADVYDSNIFFEPRNVSKTNKEYGVLENAKKALACFQVTQTSTTSLLQAANVYFDAAENFLSAVNRVRKD